MRLARLGVSLIMAGLALGCDSPPTSVNDITDPLPQMGVHTGITVVVSPSGDVSGVTDANNIEAALISVTATGGTVYLTDGDASTVDHYYTSKNIVTTGFSGVLRGESMDNTIIHAGRKSAADGDGFAPAFNPWWTSFGSATPDLPTVLQFDVPSGSVTITDLTVEAKDDQPTDLIPDFYGVPSTYMTTLIEILGGEHDTRIENVRLEGKESGAEGSRRGIYNVDTGIHVMLGRPGVARPEGFGTGDLRVRNVEVANVFGAVLFMRYQDGSMIDVEDVRASNVVRGIYSGGVFASSVRISNSNLAGHPTGWTGIELWSMPSGLEVTSNTIAGGFFSAVFLWGGVRGATISRNSIRNLSARRAGIWLRTGANGNTLHHNDFVKSGLPGWTATNPSGPGAIRLDPGTQGNDIFEMKFPAGKGKALCQMIWDRTDDPETTEYDGTNTIHNWRPCENLAERDEG